MVPGVDPENSERGGWDPHLPHPTNETFTFQDMPQQSNVNVSKTFWKYKKKVRPWAPSAPPLNPTMGTIY